MISIPINKSFSQISVVSSKLAPDEKDEGRNKGEKDKEREREEKMGETWARIPASLSWPKKNRIFRNGETRVI